MKGQRYRAFDTVGERYFKSETTCELHISVEVESAVNKDNADNTDYPEVVGYSFDMTVEQQCSSLKTNDEIVINASDIKAGETMALALARFASGSLTKEAIIASGNFLCTSTSYKADNKKILSATHKFEGTGVLSIGE